MSPVFDWANAKGRNMTETARTAMSFNNLEPIYILLEDGLDLRSPWLCCVFTANTFVLLQCEAFNGNPLSIVKQKNRYSKYLVNSQPIFFKVMPTQPPTSRREYERWRGRLLFSKG